jgi:hypothetical protein
MAIQIYSQKSNRFRLRDAYGGQGRELGQWAVGIRLRDAYGVTCAPTRRLRRDRVGSEGMR